MLKIRTHLRKIFAAKQIYVRSDGKVIFVPVSSRGLMLLAGFFVATSLWVGFATVQTIFSDDLAAQRAAQVRETELAYGAEIQRLKREYDDLNAKLVLTSDWFEEATDKLETRHNQLNDVLEQHAQISSDLLTMQKAFARVAMRSKRNKSEVELVGRSSDPIRQIMQSRNALPTQKNLGPQLTQSQQADLPDLALMTSTPHISADIYTRIASLNTRQGDLLDALEESVDLKINEFETVIAGTEILDTENFMARVLPASERAIGGAYVPLPDTRGLNTRLHQQIYRISNNLDRLQDLSQSVTKIPLSAPIHDYQVTSGFGARIDPFKKRAAFHAGVDFGTASGTPVHTTLAGTVTRAGYKGPYGLIVEIDHGNGFRTRYGHLARALVRQGQRVEFQQHIADAGNSGRSTGPHLHYEVWYDGKVRNPMAFLDAGKPIFNIAEAIQSAPQ
ncbi:peptidoglycan DD-metalloendopeptidase family protein [Alphaproteobacteria bacterium]|nr:peptidoglycan DD-metalloendopeptidase family protein [bacterium]MDC0147477.1 peptidoglycan DD-metalloendopeptidase family protein [Alphaproteobacteria bacterium]